MVRNQIAKWLGHLVRMLDERCPKRLVLKGDVAKGKRNRSTNRWLQAIKKNVFEEGTAEQLESNGTGQA